MIKTTKDRLLVLVTKKEKQKGSIILVADENTNFETAEVISVGKDLQEDIKIGQIVYFSKYSGQSIKIDEKEYLSLKIEEILAWIE